MTCGRQDHDVVAGRLPGTEKCQNCSWRFPCRDQDCGHVDCLEFRGPPLCYWCRQRVEGPRNELWCSWVVVGHTRAVHYTCRSQHASPEERARWGEAVNP